MLIVEKQRPTVADTTLKQNNKVRGLILPDSETYCKATAIETECDVEKLDKYISGTEPSPGHPAGSVARARDSQSKGRCVQAPRWAQNLLWVVGGEQSTEIVN